MLYGMANSPATRVVVFIGFGLSPGLFCCAGVRICENRFQVFVRAIRFLTLFASTRAGQGPSRGLVSASCGMIEAYVILCGVEVYRMSNDSTPDIMSGSYEFKW